MAYVLNQFGQMVYQPDPAPMDRLQQLQAQRQMTQFQQPVQGTTMFPPQQPQASQSWAYVQGEAAAKSWFVGNGQSVLLMDSESPVFYIKSADSSGIPLPLRVFDYKERTQNGPQNAPQAQQTQAEDLDSKYVTRKEYDDLQGKYTEILDRLNNFPVVNGNTESSRKTEKASGGARNKGGNADE